jgi:predicted amidophosphoribosyltransferase
LQGRESRNYKVTTVGLCPVCYPTLLKTCPVCKAEYSMYSNSCPACYKTSLVKKAKPKCPKPKRP